MVTCMRPSNYSPLCPPYLNNAAWLGLRHWPYARWAAGIIQICGCFLPGELRPWQLTICCIFFASSASIFGAMISRFHGTRNLLLWYLNQIIYKNEFNYIFNFLHIQKLSGFTSLYKSCFFRYIILKNLSYYIIVKFIIPLKLLKIYFSKSICRFTLIPGTKHPLWGASTMVLLSDP